MSPQQTDVASGFIGGSGSLLMGIFKFSFDDLHKIWIALVIALIGGTAAYFVPRFWRWLFRSRFLKKSEKKEDSDIGKD